MNLGATKRERDRSTPVLWEGVLRRFYSSVPSWGNADGCWEWSGPTNVYKEAKSPVFKWHGSVSAPRIAWLVSFNEWPADGWRFRKTCSNDVCVRPDHLYIAPRCDIEPYRIRRGGK
jgi:hypothetical protein